jgi:hypothetical protein
MPQSTAYRLLMGTPLIAGVICLSLVAILFIAALRMVHRRRVRRLSIEDPLDRYQREIREIKRGTHARSKHRYTRQLGDPPGGNYGGGFGA